ERAAIRIRDSARAARRAHRGRPCGEADAARYRGAPVRKAGRLGDPDEPAILRDGEGIVRGAELSGAPPAPLRRHRLDAAYADGYRSARHDDAADTGVPCRTRADQ